MSEKFKTGSLIAGSYRVLDFIGEGAMGLVYKVEHTLLNKILAFKVLKTEFLSEAIWKRFRLEGQAIARLDHVNIVKIYDMSQTEDGLPFFTMDLLVGQSLDDYLQDYGRLSVEDALPIFRQVCAGLAYANDHGIIHRDIKPGNIMLIDSKDGSIGKCTVKIVDFGIAKLVDDGNTSQQGLTRPGEVFGSPLYMSPEQCMGAKLDQRTDMYSVGITMFQALTGKPPLLGKSAVETAALHQSQEPPMLCDVAPDVEFPIELEEVIATMLAKSPDNRYSSLAEVANLLLQIEKGEARTSSNTTSLMPPLRNQQDDEKQRAQRSKQSKEENEEQQHAANRQGWLILSLTLILVAAAIFLVSTYIAQTEHNDEKTKHKSTAPIANPITKSLVDQPDSLTHLGPNYNETELNHQTRSDIEAFKKTNTGYYSRIGKDHGQAVKVFTFPEKFSLGTIRWSNGRQRGHFTAKGTKKIPLCRSVKLEADLAVQAYPELLMLFRPDDINWLAIEGVEHRNPLLAKSIVHLSSLNDLEIRHSELTDSDLKILEQLKNLTMLRLCGNTMNEVALANSSVLKHLKTIQIETIKEPSVLLESLLKHNQLFNLDIRHMNLQSTDFVTISKMSTLKLLTIKGTNVKDEDLKALTRLTNLTLLNVDFSNNLTTQSVTSLCKFTKLNTIMLPIQLRNRETAERLRKLLPNLIIENLE